MYEGSLMNQYNYKQYFVLILVIHIFGNDVICKFQFINKIKLKFEQASVKLNIITRFEILSFPSII